MLKKDEAKKIVEAHLNDSSEDRNYSLVILDEYTIEKDYGYVFFYDSSLYIETEDINHALGGNSPILIEKSTSKIIYTGTANSIEYYLENYEKYGSAYPPKKKGVKKR